MAIYELRKPSVDFNIRKALKILNNYKNINEFTVKADTPEYHYWDKVRFLQRPEDLSAEDFWGFIKFNRRRNPSRRPAAVTDKNSQPFTWQFTQSFESSLHQIDLNLGGQLVDNWSADESGRRKLISRGIIEEAIASSQLEGASTTRKAAKRLITEGRPPANRHEQMIINNYRAMLYIEEELSRNILDIPTLLQLHEIIGKETIGNDELARFRRDNDDIMVSNPADGTIYHLPPDEKFLTEQIPHFLDFANDSDSEAPFIHPVIKAIIIHFWLAYLHPYTDGNGRVARALFYWYLLRKGYWAFSYLPLSKIIKGSKAQYRDAFIYSEQDDNDLTYFIDYNMRKIIQALEEFERYVRREEKENRELSKLATPEHGLNDRQIQLLRHLLKNPEASTTIKAYSYINKITRMTARRDLLELEEKGFLISHKIGRELPFRATPKVKELLS